MEMLLDLFEPLIASIVLDTHDPNQFTHMDQANHAAAMTWNALPANQGTNGTVHAWSQAIADAINLAGHVIQFSGMTVRRDLVGDGYHDQTGLRLWTHAQYDYLYSHPSSGSKTELRVHLATIVNLKTSLKQQVDDSSLITSSYEAKLDYLQGVKSHFDGNFQLAGEIYDNIPTKVNLDYLNAYTQYSSYLLTATNYHVGTMQTWRPTAMPDIISIPPEYGGAPYTRSLERMVQYKLDIPEFSDSEQILFNSWQLVRQLPAGFLCSGGVF